MPRSKTKPPKLLTTDSSFTELAYRKIRELTDELEHRQRGFKIPRRHVDEPLNCRLIIYFSPRQLETIRSAVHRFTILHRRTVNRFTVPEFIRTTILRVIEHLPSDALLSEEVFRRSFRRSNGVAIDEQIGLAGLAMEISLDGFRLPLPEDEPPKTDRRTKDGLSTGRRRRNRNQKSRTENS